MIITIIVKFKKYHFMLIMFTILCFIGSAQCKSQIFLKSDDDDISNLITASVFIRT
jgi:hypothetical protein